MTRSRRTAADPGALRLEARGGGLRLVDEAGRRVAARPSGDGWAIEGPAPLEGLVLFRAAGSGFALADGDRRDADAARGRTFGGREPAGPVRWLLLDDGTAWRLVLRGPRDPRWELAGWETAGAYLVVRPTDRPGAWRIERTAAGRSLPRDAELLLLAAAEIVLAGAADDGTA